MGDVMLLNRVVRQRGRGQIVMIRDLDDAREIGAGLSQAEAVLNAQGNGFTLVSVWVDGLPHAEFLTDSPTSLVETGGTLVVEVINDTAMKMDGEYDPSMAHVVIPVPAQRNDQVVISLQNAMTKPNVAQLFAMMEVMVASRPYHIPERPDMVVQAEINRRLDRTGGPEIKPTESSVVVDEVVAHVVQPQTP
jgi:hypothetical protein